MDWLHENHPEAEPPTMADLTRRVQRIFSGETNVIEDHLRRNGVRYIEGTAELYKVAAIDAINKLRESVAH